MIMTDCITAAVSLSPRSRISTSRLWCLEGVRWIVVRVTLPRRVLSLAVLPSQDAAPQTLRHHTGRSSMNCRSYIIALTVYLSYMTYRSWKCYVSKTFSASTILRKEAGQMGRSHLCQRFSLDGVPVLFHFVPEVRQPPGAAF